MKRQTFRLGNVLRYYVLQKQRTELELSQASRVLREIDEESARLIADIAGLAALLSGPEPLSTAGWMACFRKAESLDLHLKQARTRRQVQADVVSRLEQKRKRWAIAEETLLSLRRALDENNLTEAAKAQQALLDEAVLRGWQQADADHGREP